MELTLGQIFNSTSGLEKLIKAPLPVKIAYRLKRIIDIVTNESKHIEKARQDLVKTYAEEQTEEEKKENKPQQVISKVAEFQKDFFALLGETVTVKDFKLPFSSIEDIKLTVTDIVAIEPWIEGIPEELLEAADDA